MESVFVVSIFLYFLHFVLLVWMYKFTLYQSADFVSLFCVFQRERERERVCNWILISCQPHRVISGKQQNKRKSVWVHACMHVCNIEITQCFDFNSSWEYWHNSFFRGPKHGSKLASVCSTFVQCQILCIYKVPQMKLWPSVHVHRICASHMCIAYIYKRSHGPY